MRRTLTAALCVAFGFSCSGCRNGQRRPANVTASAARVGDTFIDCSVDEAIHKYRCTVYKAGSGEILADGLFDTLSGQGAASQAELRYAGFQSSYGEPSIVLLDSQILSFEEAGEQDPTNRLINDRLKVLSASTQGPAIDCGKTAMSEPSGEVSACARTAFERGKPFYVRYLRRPNIPYVSYGLAGNGEGKLYEIVYDFRGLLDLGLPGNARVFSENRIRVTQCLEPVALGRTEAGIPACVQPVNKVDSEYAAQQLPVDTTVCAITENPSLYNNRLVRIHGEVSMSPEYAEVGTGGCPGSLWFRYGDDSAPPGLVAHIGGGSEPGGQDSEGKRILPVPVKLVKNANFDRFEHLIRVQVRADARAAKTNPEQYPSHRVSATLLGRIDGVAPDIHSFHLKRADPARADFLGFGTMGLFDAQFVLQAVEGRSVLLADPPIPR